MSAEQNQIQQEQKPKNKGGRYALKRFFSAKRMAVMAIFVSLSYIVSLLPPIPMPLFGASFLSLDFSNVFILLISFLLGPIEGTIVCFLKESLCLLTTKTSGAGELANFITGTALLFLPGVMYRYRKNFKIVVGSLVAACFIATGVALLANRFIVFPYFAKIGGGTIFGMTVKEAFATFLLALILFNIIKSIVISVLTILLYKRLSLFFKKMKI